MTAEDRCKVYKDLIKSKNYFVSYLGACSDDKKHDMCEDCMREFKTYLHAKMRGGEVND